MKTMRAVLTCLAVLALMGLASTRASAGAMDLNCTTSASSCGFGAFDASMSGSLSGSGHSATFVEDVFKSGSVYTYVFQIKATSAGIDSAKASTVTISDNFNCQGGCLDYGIVDGGISNGTASNEQSTSFFGFGQATLNITFESIMTKNSYLTFYVQGGAPVAGNFNIGDGFLTTASNNALVAPEPDVLTLLGSLVLLMMIGLPFASRLKAATT